MNRQQRRLMKRQKAVERKYLTEIEERQNAVDDRVVEIYTICIATALNNLYGWKHHGINRVVSEFCRLITEVNNDSNRFYRLRAELKEKTGIEFQWRDEEAG